MPLTSFKKQTETTQPQGEAQEAIVALTPTSTAVAVRDEKFLTSAESGQVEGEFSSSDINTPRLNIVAKTGELSDLFSPGSLVMNKEIVISDGKNPIDVTVLRIKKRYEKVNEIDSGEDYVTYDTYSEVAANNGKLVYGKAQADKARNEGTLPFTEIANLLVLIPAPVGATEDVLANFPYQYEDRNYALVMWTVRNSSYFVAKSVITAAVTRLKTGLQNGKWSLGTKLQKSETLSWFTPLFSPAGSNDPKFAEFASSLI